MSAKGRLKKTADLTATWKCVLAEDERKAIKGWVERLKSAAECDLKLGKERSRLSLRFEEGLLKSKAAEEMRQIAMLMEKIEELKSSGAIEAVQELSEAGPAAQRMWESTYQRVLAQSWAKQKAKELEGLLPERARTTLRLEWGP